MKPLPSLCPRSPFQPLLLLHASTPPTSWNTHHPHHGVHVVLPRLLFILFALLRIFSFLLVTHLFLSQGLAQLLPHFNVLLFSPQFHSMLCVLILLTSILQLLGCLFPSKMGRYLGQKVYLISFLSASCTRNTEASTRCLQSFEWATQSLIAVCHLDLLLQLLTYLFKFMLHCLKFCWSVFS